MGMISIKTKHKANTTLIVAALLSLVGSMALAAVEPIDRVAAVVEDDIIMESEVKKRTADVLTNIKKQNMQVPPEDILQREVMEQLILESLQLQLGARAGVRVSDTELNQTMTRLAQQNGLSLEEFQMALAREGMSYREMREQVRNEMITKRVREGRVGSRIQITDQEVQNYLKSESGKQDMEAQYALGHILIKVPESATDAEAETLQRKAETLQSEIAQGADFEALAKLHSAGPEAANGGIMGIRRESQLPSLFLDVAQTLEIDQISQPFRSPNGFHLLKLFNKRGGDRIMVEQTRVRHILLKTSEIRDDEQAKQELIELKSNIENGADFGDLARKHSDDTGTMSDGGNLGWMNARDLVPGFRNVMLTAEPNVISEPFQSRFGWHILEVLERRDHNMADNVKLRMARDAIFRRKFDEELEIWLQEARTDAYVDIKLY